MKRCLQCSVCGETKEDSISPTTGKHRSNCRSCRAATARRARASHPDRIAANKRRFYVKHAEAIRAGRRTWHHTHREQEKAYGLKWTRRNVDRCKTYNAARRAKKRNAPGRGVLAAQWREVRTNALGLCAYCNQHEPLTQDHIEPLSRGGEHDPTNLAAACYSCNSSKRERPLLLWLAKRALERAA